MWPFKKPAPDLQLADLFAAIERNRQETKRWREEIEMEWSDMFDRFRRLYAKIAKRAKDAESGAIGGQGDSEVGIPLDRPGNGASEPVHGVLAHRSRLRGW